MLVQFELERAQILFGDVIFTVCKTLIGVRKIYHLWQKSCSNPGICAGSVLALLMP